MLPARERTTVSVALVAFKFGRNVTLNLSGSKGRMRVQRLEDKDALVVSKCLKSNRRVTGERTDPRGLRRSRVPKFFSFHRS